MSDGFRTSWAKGCAKANTHGLTFHHLRGVGTMLDAIDRDVKLAEIATMKLETRTNLQTAL